MDKMDKHEADRWAQQRIYSDFSRALAVVQGRYDHATPPDEQECDGEPPCRQCGHKHQCERWAEAQIDEIEWER